jgi:TonB family protein
VPETLSPVATKPLALVAEEPSPPTGKFFERNDVDEPPQIATRVEPQLPADLPARSTNAVVVVRLLVSRTGHPFRVSLLRGSALGRSADEAVVAAVARWTFSPAKKRGEPVNCWYNIGVPLGHAN